MKKILILLVCTILIMSGCGTYTGMGAYTGSTIGSILGSAIGGITGGPRGSDIGTIIGMAGGAIIGGAVGAQADEERQQRVERARTNSRNYPDYGYSNDYPDYGSYDNGMQGDDRIYDSDGNDGNMSSRYNTNSEIRLSNLRYVNSRHDAVLRSNEVTKIVFEVRNVTSHTLYNIQPVVEEITGNKHIWISPSAFIENLQPGRAVRYTAMVSCGKLRNGTAMFRVSVNHNGRLMTEPYEFSLPIQR